MDKKGKIELIIIFIFSFAVVISAPLITNLTKNTELKFLLRAGIYIILAAAPVILAKLFKRPVGSLGLKKGGYIKQILSGFAIFAVLALVFTAASLLLGENRNILLPAKTGGVKLIILNIAFFMLFVGPCEELLFRGYFLERFKSLTGKNAWGIALSSLTFGLWHFPGSGDIFQVVLTSLIGALFAFSMTKFKNSGILSVALAHGMHDTFILLLSCVLP
jgi:membrane protease YdiL (CAAX protease family)